LDATRPGSLNSWNVLTQLRRNTSRPEKPEGKDRP
jgi:hypothetical protein